MTAKLTGGCLCQSLRYEITGEIGSDTNYCHCRMCQRSAGSPVLVFTGVPEEKFKWTKGQPKRYQSSEAAFREFCPNCGCQLTFREGKELDVTTATLDDPEPFKPSIHIYCSTQLSWVKFDDQLPRHTEGRRSQQLH